MPQPDGPTMQKNLLSRTWKLIRSSATRLPVGSVNRLTHVLHDDLASRMLARSSVAAPARAETKVSVPPVKVKAPKAVDAQLSPYGDREGPLAPGERGGLCSDGATTWRLPRMLPLTALGARSSRTRMPTHPAPALPSQAAPEREAATARQYGNCLTCVRYRYDPEWKKRFKVVELLAGSPTGKPCRSPYAEDEIVAVRIGFAEAGLRQQATSTRRRKRAGFVACPRLG